MTFEEVEAWYQGLKAETEVPADERRSAIAELEVGQWPGDEEVAPKFRKSGRPDFDALVQSRRARKEQVLKAREAEAAQRAADSLLGQAKRGMRSLLSPTPDTASPPDVSHPSQPSAIPPELQPAPASAAPSPLTQEEPLQVPEVVVRPRPEPIRPPLPGPSSGINLNTLDPHERDFYEGRKAQGMPEEDLHEAIRQYRAIKQSDLAQLEPDEAVPDYLQPAKTDVRPAANPLPTPAAPIAESQLAPTESPFASGPSAPAGIQFTDRAGKPTRSTVPLELRPASPVPRTALEATQAVTQPLGKFATKEARALGRHSVRENARQAINSAVQGFAQMVGGVPKGLAIGTEALADLLPDSWQQYRGGKGVQFVHAFGQKIEDLAKQYFPTDPQRQEEFFATIFPQAFGSMAGFMTAGVAGRAAGLSPGASAATMGAAVEGASQFEDAGQMGADRKTQLKAYALGLVNGLTEGLPIENLFKNLDRLSGGTLSQRIKAAGLVGLQEGLQELQQQIGSNAIAQTLYDTDRKLLQGVGEATGAGAGSGFLTAFLSGMVGARLRGKQATPEEVFKATGLTETAQRQASPTIPPELQPLAEPMTSRRPEEPLPQLVPKARREAQAAISQIPQELQIAQRPPVLRKQTQPIPAATSGPERITVQPQAKPSTTAVETPAPVERTPQSQPPAVQRPEPVQAQPSQPGSPPPLADLSPAQPIPATTPEAPRSEAAPLPTELQPAKADARLRKATPEEEAIAPEIFKPRHALPPAKSHELLLRAEKAKADMEIAEATGMPAGGKILDFDTRGQGGTPDVTYIQSSNPDWYKELTSGKNPPIKGDKKQSARQKIEDAIARIIRDEGADRGAAVEKVKQALLNDQDFRTTPWGRELEQAIEEGTIPQGDVPPELQPSRTMTVTERAQAMGEIPELEPESNTLREQISLFGDPDSAKRTPIQAPKEFHPRSREQTSLPMDIPFEAHQERKIAREVQKDEAPLFSEQAKTPEPEQTALPSQRRKGNIPAMATDRGPGSSENAQPPPEPGREIKYVDQEGEEHTVTPVRDAQISLNQIIDGHAQEIRRIANDEDEARPLSPQRIPGKILVKEVGDGKFALVDGFSRTAGLVAAGQKRFPVTIVRHRSSPNPSGPQQGGPSSEQTGLSMREQTATYEAPAPTFFSQAARTIEQKMPARASREQIQGILSPQNGVKPDELKWLDLDRFLRSKESFTKQEVLDFVRSNQVQIQEVEKREANDFSSPEDAIAYIARVEGWTPEIVRDNWGYQNERDYISLAESMQGGKGDAKFSAYQLPGGTNYRELLLTLPDRSASNFRSSHFTEPNILAHVRMNDRTGPNGEKVLFLEEVQSDWHQQGRKKGYRNLADLARIQTLRQERVSIAPDVNSVLRDMDLLGFDTLKAAKEAIIEDPDFAHRWEIDPRHEPLLRRYRDLYHAEAEARRAMDMAVPDAPFKKTWHELALKRMLRYAAEHGYDSLAWTTGEQQAERYDLSKQVDQIQWEPRRGAKDGVRTVEIVLKDHINPIKFDTTPEGKVSTRGYSLSSDIDGKALSDVVGKDIADKIMGQADGVLSGEGLKIGGEGMKGFYDRIIPQFLDKYVKKWGAKVGTLQIDTADPRGRRLSVTGPHPDGAYRLSDQTGTRFGDYAFSTITEAERFADELAAGRTTVHALPITDAMKHSVLTEGQALFERATPYQPASPRQYGIPSEADPPISSHRNNDPVKAHADYKAAKAGDIRAAVRLVKAMVKPETVSEAVRRFAGAIFVAPMAQEASGKNAIPQALAAHYAHAANGTLDDSIVQTNKPFHTGAGAMERMIVRPQFTGPVTQGGRYVLVDDVTTLGGTLAELANHIRQGGGKVVGVITLTNASRTATMSPSSSVVRFLKRRHGYAIRDIFGVEPEALTAAEAGYLSNFRDADSLRNRAATAGRERQQRLSARGLPQSQDRALSDLPDYPVRPGDDAKKAHQLAQGALRDLDAVPPRDRTMGGDRRPPGRAGAGLRTVGLGISPELIRTGRIDLRGHQVNTVRDLAQLAQVYRDPRFETLRIIYTKGGQIVAHEGVTSRLPSSTAAFISSTSQRDTLERMHGPNVANTLTRARHFELMRRRMQRLGADGYYLIHNHPSGNPTPSDQDIKLTRAFAKLVPGFKGHVVINSGRYATIDQESNGNLMSEIHGMPEVGADRLLSPSTPHPLLGQRVKGQADLVRMAKALQAPKGYVSLMFLDMDALRVRALQEIPSGLFYQPKAVGSYIKARQREFGSVHVVAVDLSESRPMSLHQSRAHADRLIRQGVLVDYLDRQGHASSLFNLADWQEALEQERSDPDAFRVAEPGPNREERDHRRQIDDIEAQEQVFAKTRVKPTTPRIQPAPLTGGGTPKPFRQMLFDFSKALDQRLTRGRTGARAAGVYMPGSTATIIKRANDLDTAAHELAHALDDRFDLLGPAGTFPFDNELSAFWPHGSVTQTGPRSTLQYKRAEGVAEYLRAWIVNPQAAEAAAPRFSQHLWTRVTPDVKKAIEDFSKDVRTFAGASGIEQIGANVAEASERQTAWQKFLGHDETKQPGFGLSRRDKLAIKWTDRLVPFIKGYEYALGEQGITKVLPAHDPRVLARLYHGMNAIMDDVIAHGMFKDARKRTRATGGGIEWLLEPLDKSSLDTLQKEKRDVARYMIAQRTIEKGDQFARESNISGIGGGIFTDTAVAEKAIREIASTPDRKQRFDEAAKRYRQWADANLTYLLAKGRISKQTYDDIKANNEYYVAMQRLVEISPEEELAIFKPPLGRHGRLGSVSQPIEQMKGSTLTIKDPYDALLDATYKAIREADRNEILRWYVQPLSSPRGLHQGEPMDLASVARKAKQGEPHTVPIFTRGQAEFWQFHPEIFTAIKGLRDGLVRWPWSITVLPNLLRSTIVNAPPFAIRNVFRDQIHRTVVSNVGSQPLSSLKLFSEAEQSALKRYGGDQAGHYYQDADQYTKAMKAALEKMTAKKTTILVNAKRLGRGYLEIMQQSERQGRLAEYQKAYKVATTKGVDLGDGTLTKLDPYNAAIYAASEARGLMDYAVAGETMAYLNRVIPFSNAAVQGVRINVKRFMANPTRYAGRFLLWAALPSVLTYLWNWWKDDLDEYRQLPAYQRDLFYNLKVGDNLWLAYPKAFEIGVLGTSVERALDFFNGNPKAFEGHVGAFLRTLLPIDEASFAGPFQGAVQAMANYDFFRDRHIVPTWEEKLELPLRKTYRGSRLGQALQAAVGVDARKIDFLFNQQLGYLGRYMTRVSDLGREDKQGLGLPDTGLFRPGAGPVSLDVRWIHDRADERGIVPSRSKAAEKMESVDQVRGETEKIKNPDAVRLAIIRKWENRFYEAKDDAMREQIGKRLREEAKKLRTLWEANAPRPDAEEKAEEKREKEQERRSRLLREFTPAPSPGLEALSP